jgi:hypothetical protein
MPAHPVRVTPKAHFIIAQPFLFMLASSKVGNTAVHVMENLVTFDTSAMPRK